MQPTNFVDSNHDEELDGSDKMLLLAVFGMWMTNKKQLLVADQ